MAKYRITPSSRTIVQSPISIGHKAEKGVEAIEFDVTAWVETYGSGTLTVIMRRWGDAIPYPIALEIDENNKATWTLSDTDTARAGMAYAQLSYIVGETVVKKSDIYTFRVMDSLTGEGEPPEAYESWLEHLTHLAAEAMAEVLDIEGIVTDKTLTVDGGIADAKATGDALALKADKSTTYTKAEVDQMIEDVDVETDTTLTVSGAPADAKKTGDELSALKADLENQKDCFNSTQRGLMLDQTVTGTRYKIVDLDLAPGDYVFTCDSVASADEDATTCLVTFAKSLPTVTTVASLSVARGIAVSEKVTISEATDKMYFFASDSSAHAAGDAFTYTNVKVSKILSDSTLTKDGGFADAKATGDAINTINDNLGNLEAGVEADISDIEKKVLNSDNSLYVFGAKDLLVNNAFLKVNGNAQANNSYKCSNFIPVKSGQILKYGLYSTSTTAVICFYTSDSETAFSAYVAGTGSFAEGSYTIPTDGYIRFATANTHFDSSYCYTEAQLSPNVEGTAPIESTLKILLLGDSIFGNDGEIAADLGVLCKSCVNGAFGGTRVTSRGSGDWQYFDGINLAQALATQTWTAQDTAAANLAADYTWITSRLSGLKAVDMSNIDIVCMDWGTNDYTSACTIEEIITAYNTVIDTLQTAYPEIRILICTPIWRCWGDESDDDNGDNHVVNVSTLKEIAIAIEQFAKDKRISVLNAYQNLPLSYKTRDTYFDAIGSGNTGTSYTHLNTYGNQVYAYLIHGKIRSIF